jgi:glucosamine--fructose-6-phosphate aminotransferase (isomerizing)
VDREDAWKSKEICHMQEDVITLLEIQSQPAIWQRCLEDLGAANLHCLAKDRAPSEVEWVFIGCGTSFYVAQAAAYSFSALHNVVAKAAPASEVLFNENLTFPKGMASYYPVLISRSGQTTEMLRVAQMFKLSHVRFLLVTCDGRDLETMTDRVLKVRLQERSTVMTASFSSMLLALQFLAATLAADTEFLDALQQLPKHLECLLKRYGEAVEHFAQQDVENVVMLGQGALHSIACEVALKVMESSLTCAMCFHTLEFRHGPRSIVGPSTLIGGLISDASYDQEVAVLSEMKELGARVFAVVNTAGEELKKSADLVIELGLPVPELARLIIYVAWGQLFGTYRGLKKGLKPDIPRNLTRVVII